MDETNLTQETFTVDYRQDSLPPITAGMYESFLARGPVGVDALLCYQHLLYTYRRQRTDRVRATRGYMMRGLHMGRDRVIAARALLDEMGITEPYVTKDEKGRITGHYVKLCLQPNPGQKSPKKSTVRVFHTVDDPHGGSRPQMLEEGIEVLEEKRESAPEKAPTPDPSVPLSSSASLPGGKAFRDRLTAKTREILGTNTTYTSQAEKLVKGGEDEDMVLDAWELMLRERPAGAPYFAKDYPTRWKPKVCKARPPLPFPVHEEPEKAAEVKHRCPGCGRSADYHVSAGYFSCECGFQYSGVTAREYFERQDAVGISAEAVAT